MIGLNIIVNFNKNSKNNMTNKNNQDDIQNNLEEDMEFPDREQFCMELDNRYPACFSYCQISDSSWSGPVDGNICASCDC